MQALFALYCCCGGRLAWGISRKKTNRPGKVKPSFVSRDFRGVAMLRVLRSLVVLSAIVVLSGAAPAASAPEKRVALVVGMSRYQHVPPLANTSNDARLMAETLQSLGFKLVGGKALIDLDKKGLEQAIRSFGEELARSDVGLFYYAGHGIQMQGVNYLVPIGANAVRPADADFELIDAGLLLRQMEASGARLNLMILDACRNNPFGLRGLRDFGAGLAQMRAPAGTLISYATQPGNAAIDGLEGGRNSPYTKALAETMRKPGVDVLRLFNEVGLIVSHETNGAQQPWMSSSPIEGDFYFAGAASPPVAATAPLTPTPAPAPPVSASLAPANSMPSQPVVPTTSVPLASSLPSQTPSDAAAPSPPQQQAMSPPDTTVSTSAAAPAPAPQQQAMIAPNASKAVTGPTAPPGRYDGDWKGTMKAGICEFVFSVMVTNIELTGTVEKTTKWVVVKEKLTVLGEIMQDGSIYGRVGNSFLRGKFTDNNFDGIVNNLYCVGISMDPSITLTRAK